MNEIHDLAAPYVLDALDVDERSRFEQHLDGCHECCHLIRELSWGAEVLFDELAEEPPRELRARVLDDLDTQAVPLRRRTTPRWVAPVSVAAAFLVVLVGIYVSALGPQELDPVTAIVTAADAVTVPLEGIDGDVVHLGGGAVFRASDLPLVAEDRTYQLWLIGDEGPVSAGLFRPDPSGEAIVLLEGEVSPGLVVGLTEEPAGGSPQPTGEVIASAEL